MNRGSLTTPPSPHDAPACPPASDSECTPSGCELALKSSGQAFRVPSRGAPPVSGLSPASAPSRLLLRRPTPRAVKGGAKHLDEEGGGYGHSRFTGHSERHTAAEAEQPIRGAPISRHAGARRPGRTALFAADSPRSPLRPSSDRSLRTWTASNSWSAGWMRSTASSGSMSSRSAPSRSSIVHPREVFKPLILMNAAAWICAHNHPSGDPTPSQEDRVLTSRLRQGADLLGITLAGPSHPHRRALLQLRRSGLARCVRA